MKKEVIHKLRFGEHAPCGVDYFDFNKGIGHSVHVAYRWKKVTCKRCLKTRK